MVWAVLIRTPRTNVRQIAKVVRIRIRNFLSLAVSKVLSTVKFEVVLTRLRLLVLEGASTIFKKGEFLRVIDVKSSSTSGLAPESIHIQLSVAVYHLVIRMPHRPLLEIVNIPHALPDQYRLSMCFAEAMEAWI